MLFSVQNTDFSMIYEIVRDNEKLFLEKEVKIENEKDSVIPANFDWRMYEFDTVRLKFKAVNCYKSMGDLSIDKDRENAILSQMDEVQKQWNDVTMNDDDDISNTTIRKMGGIAQTKSFYEYGGMPAISLYGPWIDDGIKVKGRVDVPIYNEEKEQDNDDAVSNDKPAIVIIHEEEWDLKQDDGNNRLFKGDYIVRQRNEILDKENIDPNGQQMQNFAPMDWVYDVEIVLK